MNISDKELELIMKNCLAIKEYIPDARIAENARKQLATMVNEALSILRKVAGNSTPMGGSAITKNLFEMFHLNHRLV